MSMVSTHYVIAGYDLSKRRHLLDDSWKWTDDGEKWTCMASDGHIQVLLDIQENPSLYFGFIIARVDEYNEKNIKISLDTILKEKEAVDKALKEVGFPASIIENLPDYEILIVTDWN